MVFTQMAGKDGFVDHVIARFVGKM